MTIFDFPDTRGKLLRALDAEKSAFINQGERIDRAHRGDEARTLDRMGDAIVKCAEKLTYELENLSAALETPNRLIDKAMFRRRLAILMAECLCDPSSPLKGDAWRVVNARVELELGE